MIYNKVQNEEFVRGVTFQTYMEEPEVKNIYSGFLPFKKKYDSFRDHFGGFQDEAKNKNKSKAGTLTKEGLKKSISKRLAIYLGFTKDYAIDKMNDGLKLLVSYSESDIQDMKEGNLLEFINTLMKDVFKTSLMTDVDFMTYNITAIKLSTLVADAVLYNSMVGTVNTGGNNSSSANDKMDEFMNLIHLDFASMDLTVKEFEESNPDFVLDYHKNKTIIDTGTRHEGFKGFVRKNGVLEPASMVEIVGTNKTTVSGNDASFKMYCRPGTIKVQAKNANGDSQTKEIVVTHRNMTDVDFDLE